MKKGIILLLGPFLATPFAGAGMASGDRDDERYERNDDHREYRD